MEHRRGRRVLGTQALLKKSAVELVEAARPQREHIADERQVDFAFHDLVQGAVLGAGQPHVHLSAEFSGIRLRSDDADRAAHRFRAVESALRPAQHLDARYIDDVRIERLEHRCIVDVEAGGIRTLDPA